MQEGPISLGFNVPGGMRGSFMTYRGGGGVYRATEGRGDPSSGHAVTV